MRLRDLVPGEDLGHAGVQAALQHQPVGGGGLLQVGEVRPLQALLVHPHVADVEGAVEAGGARADHHHAALLADEDRHREGRFARVFEDDVDVLALAGDVPDGLAELADLVEPLLVFLGPDLRQLAPAVEVLSVQHALGPEPHDELALVLVRDDADGVRARRVDQLDRIGAKTPRGAPDQHVHAGLQFVRLVPEQHPVGGGQRQGVAGGLFPGQVLGAGHQLLGLDAGELREGAVGRLVAPDALGRRIHRVAPVAFLVVAVVLVAVDDDLVADLPVADLVAHLPDDPRGVRARDVVRLLVDVEHADRHAEPGPDAVVVDARRHHQDQHLVAVDLPGVHDLDLHRLVGLALALAPDRPGIHLPGHVAEGRHLADFVQVLDRRVVGGDRGWGVQGHDDLLAFMPQRRSRACESSAMRRSATLQ